MLIEAPACYDAFYQSIADGNVIQTKEYLDEGQLEDVIINEGLTIACFRKIVVLVRMLMAYGASPQRTSILFNAVYSPEGISCLIWMKDYIDLSLTTWYKWTSAHLAVRYANIEIVKGLFALEAMIRRNREISNRLISARTNIGESVLHLAAAHSLAPVLEFLLSEGADIDASTAAGATPLHYAARGGRMKNVTLLISRGCNILSVTRDRRTPYDVAIQNRHQEVAKFLLQQERATSQYRQLSNRDLPSVHQLKIERLGSPVYGSNLPNCRDMKNVNEQCDTLSGDITRTLARSEEQARLTNSANENSVSSRHDNCHSRLTDATPSHDRDKSKHESLKLECNHVHQLSDDVTMSHNASDDVHLDNNSAGSVNTRDVSPTQSKSDTNLDDLYRLPPPVNHDIQRMPRNLRRGHIVELDGDSSEVRCASSGPSDKNQDIRALSTFHTRCVPVSTIREKNMQLPERNKQDSIVSSQKVQGEGKVPVSPLVAQETSVRTRSSKDLGPGGRKFTGSLIAPWQPRNPQQNENRRRQRTTRERQNWRQVIRDTNTAISRNDIDSFRWYLHLGVESHFMSREGQSLLTSCLHSMPCFQTLLQLDCDVNVRDRKGKTTLHYACAMGDEACCIKLLDKGARMDVRDNNGRIPLHTAIFQSVTVSQDPNRSNAYTNIVAMLTEKGSDVNAQDHQNSTAVYLAVVTNSVTILDVLMHYGARLNDISRYNTTPLVEGCHRGANAIVQALVNWGVDVNAHDWTMKRSAFKVACVRGHLSICDLLIKAGTTLTSEAWMYTLEHSSHVWYQGREEMKGPTYLYITSLTSHPRSLMDRCQVAIYSSLKPKKEESVAKLPLPNLIKRILLSIGTYEPEPAKKSPITKRRHYKE